ncbi:hypothetical protein QYF61_025949, partial [Mycteria americana]
MLFYACTAFNILRMNRMECALSKFVDDTKLERVINTLKGRIAFQRDLNRLTISILNDFSDMSHKKPRGCRHSHESSNKKNSNRVRNTVIRKAKQDLSYSQGEGTVLWLQHAIHAAGLEVSRNMLSPAPPNMVASLHSHSMQHMEWQQRIAKTRKWRYPTAKEESRAQHAEPSRYAGPELGRSHSSNQEGKPPNHGQKSRQQGGEFHCYNNDWQNNHAIKSLNRFNGNSRSVSKAAHKEIKQPTDNTLINHGVVEQVKESREYHQGSQYPLCFPLYTMVNQVWGNGQWTYALVPDEQANQHPSSSATTIASAASQIADPKPTTPKPKKGQKFTYFSTAPLLIFSTSSPSVAQGTGNGGCAWGPSHGKQSSMNCSSMGPFHRVQSFRNRLLQFGSPMGVTSPASKPAWALLSTGPARSLLQLGLPRVSQPPSGIHLLWRGVLHGLQMDICSTINLHGLQGHSLPHHGLHQGLQGNLCSGSCSTSSPPSSLTLAFNLISQENVGVPLISNDDFFNHYTVTHSMTQTKCIKGFYDLGNYCCIT